MRQRLLIATTVPETLTQILQQQPRYLSEHFDVFLVTSPGDELEHLRTEGVPIHCVEMVRGISPLKDLISLVRMVILLWHVKPDIVQSYTPKAGFICMLAAWLCRTPIRVHTFTGLIWPSASGWRQRLLIAVDRVLSFCASHLVAEGAGVQRDLREFDITAKPVHLIGHGNIAGVDIEHFCPDQTDALVAAKALRQACQIQEHDFVFIFVGRLNRDKGIDELVTAFEQLPRRCHLFVVGGLDRTAPVCNRTMRSVSSHSRIHWLGFQSDIRPAVLAADVLVLPSYREGFPNVILQAGALSRPVIATDINGSNEIIVPGLNGWLVAPRDSGKLAQAMAQAALARKEDLQAMGDAARARIAERFERRAHWERLVTYYHTLSATEAPAQGTHRLLMVASLAESIENFRGDLLAAFQAHSVEIHIAAPSLSGVSELQQRLAAKSWTLHEIPLQRTGMNPLYDLLTLWRLWLVIHKVRPTVVFSYTIKPVIYGTLAAWIAQVPARFAMITGLGYTFMGHSERGAVVRLAQLLYRFSLRRARKVFFQNADDMTLFRQRRLLSEFTPSCVVNGSGVNLSRFVSMPPPASGNHFLLIARLLGNKGVREYAKAARIVKAGRPDVQFSLVGWIDENPDAIRPSELEAWVNDGVLTYLGLMTDVRPAIYACSVYVLPSYREGTPRTVLEAMAIGRAIITTDAPGCRETVIDGFNGVLVPPGSVDALVDAMFRFINEPGLAQHMGQRSRVIAEKKYDVHKVNEVVLREMGFNEGCTAHASTQSV